MAHQKVRKETAKLVRAGRYWIGDDFTANAGPRHLVTLCDPVWIDIHPVTIGEVQRCILDGGLSPKLRSFEVSGSQNHDHLTVDAFFKLVLQTTERLFNTKRTSRLLSTYPACGLLLDEAQQICRFFGARLPNEIEWEVALSWTQDANKRESQSTGQDAPPFVSRLGCECYAGIVQEWTISEWTSRYWIESNEVLPKVVTENSPVSVRGCLPTAKLASQYARIAANAADDSVPRVFRRVWDARSSVEKP